MTKADYLLRLSHVVTRLERAVRHARLMRGMVGAAADAELVWIEKQLTAVEDELSDQIDEYMANLYNHHNFQRNDTVDARGLFGVWRRKRVS